MKMKTSELDFVALDWAVSQAIAWPVRIDGLHVIDRQSEFGDVFSPSTDWGKGGWLIDEFKVGLLEPRKMEDYWTAWVKSNRMIDGETALIAICRAVVFAKLGDEIEIPDDLI